ncbi:MAG TPA: GNAT family protein [Longimicrobium sp.]|nr:GNAT family protein [Longimicrobium sp.]
MRQADAPHCALAPFAEDDFDRLIGWIASAEAMRAWTADAFAYPLTRAQLRRHVRESAESGWRRIYKAVDGESGEAFGHIELGAIDARNRSLRLARVLVDPARRGRGLGEAMVRAALAVAFGEMGMHRVELGVFDFNAGAIACYARAGFRRDGVRRDSLAVPGGYWSEVIMSILAPEWAALPPAGG